MGVLGWSRRCRLTGGWAATTGRILPRCIRCFGSEGAALELDAERQVYQLRTGGEGPALPIAAIPTAHGPLVLAIAHSHAQAGAQSSATGPHLLIMHPLLPAVVAALALPLPVHGTPPAHVQLVPLGVTPTSGGGAYALVTLHRPVAGAVSAGAGAGKAVVSLLEARVPPHGVGIAGMLGSAERTAAFVLPKDAIGAQTTTEAERLVQEIEEVLAGRTLGEDDAARVEAIWQDAGKEVKSGLKPREVKRLVRAVLGPAVGPVLEDESGRANAAIPVRGVKGTYVRAVLQDLVGCAVVSDAMAAHGGVLACLIRLGDWVGSIPCFMCAWLTMRHPQELIDLALEVIPNLPSGSLLAALLAVLKPHTVGRSAAPDLETFLARYITVPIAGPTHRAHLHRALNVTAAATVLEVLVEWLEEWRTETTDGLLEWDEARGPTQRKQGGAELPPVQAVGPGSLSLVTVVLTSCPPDHHPLNPPPRLAPAPPRRPAAVPRPRHAARVRTRPAPARPARTAARPRRGPRVCFTGAAGAAAGQGAAREGQGQGAWRGGPGRGVVQARGDCAVARKIVGCFIRMRRTWQVTPKGPASRHDSLPGKQYPITTIKRQCAASSFLVMSAGLYTTCEYLLHRQ